MTDNLRGILAILISAMGFVTNDAIVKVVTSELPTGQIIFLRGLLATSIMGLLVSISNGWRPVSVLASPAMAIRLVVSGLATLFIIAALRHLPLPTTSAILQVSPLIVTAGSAVLLGATVGWRRWAASLVGFLGVLLVIKPGGESFVPEVWLALLALLASSSRDLVTRFIDHSVPSIFVTFATSGLITLMGLALWPFEIWVVPSSQALMLLTAAAVCLFFAYQFGVVAMRIGEVAVVAPFRYSMIVLALLLGYFIWGYVPDAVSVVGIALICGAGLYLLVQERAGIRKPRPATTTAPVAARQTP